MFYVAHEFSCMVRPACILDDGGGEQAWGATITSVVVSASRRRYCYTRFHLIPWSHGLIRLSYWVIIMMLRLAERVLLGWIAQTLRWLPLLKIGLAIWLMCETTDMESPGVVDVVQQRQDKEAYRVSWRLFGWKI
jgi:hypothetical protein